MIRPTLLRFAALAAAVLGPVWTAPTVLAQGRDAVASAEETVRSSYKNVTVERVTEKTTVIEKAVVERKVKERYRCAIFVANRAERIDDKKVLVMQDLFTGYGADKGIEIIAREDVLNSVAKLSNAGPNKGDPKLAGAQLDEMLSNNTSALRLAGDINADYVLMVTISSFGTNKQTFNDPKSGINVVAVTSQMKATFRMLDTTLGATQTAGVATASIMDRAGAGNVIVRETVVDDLIDAVAADMTSMLSTRLKAGRVADVGPAKQPNQFEIHCGVADMVFPEIIKNEKGEYTVTAGRYKLEQMAVTVELDGVVVGTTPGPFNAKPGLHKLRLRRAMFRDWEGTVNIADGQVLQIAMQMTPEGLQQFAAMTKFMQELKLNTILTDAQAKMWEGYAKQLEQSGVRVDKKVNINRSIQHDSKDLEKPAAPQPPPAAAPNRTTEEVPPAPPPGGNVIREESRPPLPTPLPETTPKP